MQTVLRLNEAQVTEFHDTNQIFKFGNDKVSEKKKKKVSEHNNGDMFRDISLKHLTQLQYAEQTKGREWSRQTERLTRWCDCEVKWLQ